MYGKFSFVNKVKHIFTNDKKNNFIQHI